MGKINTTVIRNQTRNQATFDNTVKNIFLWNNEYEAITFKNDSGAELTLIGGELIGRVGADLKGVRWTTGAADGSEKVYGVNSTSIVLAIAEEVDIQVAISGDIAEDLIILEAGTLDQLRDNVPVRDLISSETKGIKLITASEQTKFDN